MAGGPPERPGERRAQSPELFKNTLQCEHARRFVAVDAGHAQKGRPRLVTALRGALDEDDTLERLRRVAIERMEAGDPAFWKMLLDRVWPARVELSAETESVVEFRWAGREADEPR